MKRWLIASLVVLSSMLAGCATPTIRSQVTTFHELPDGMQNKTYVFERTREQDESLEYRAYEKLVRAELDRLGFVETPLSANPALKATFNYSISVRDVREIYPVVVQPYGPSPMWHPYYGAMYYSPFWYGPPIVEHQESTYQVFTRQLRVVLARRQDGQKLYETTVVSEGSNGSLAAVMPYLVRSAFADFPGTSGVPRVVELKMEKEARQKAEK
jgi:hypothetical protein